MVNNRYKLFLWLTLIVLIVVLNNTASTPVNTSDPAIATKDVNVTESTLIIKSDNGSFQGPQKVSKNKKKKRKKKKRKRKRKKKTYKGANGDDPFGNIVSDLASVFANFLSSVDDVPKNDDAIKVIQSIADSVSMRWSKKYSNDFVCHIKYKSFLLTYTTEIFIFSLNLASC